MNLSVTVLANRRQVRRMVFMDMSDEVVRIRALLMLEMVDFCPACFLA
jgi:hypothetical protein